MRKIAGKEPKNLKAKIWRELAGYDPLANDEFDFDGCVEKIALVYGVSADEVVEELDLAEVFPVFMDCIRFVNSLVLSKLDAAPKNGESVQQE